MFNFNLLYYLFKKEIKSIYVGSTFGMLWIIIRPLLLIMVFWLVFSKIMQVRPYAGKVDVPYIFFLLSTLFFWFGFQESIARVLTSVIEKGEMIKRVSMPLEVFPIISVLLSHFLHIFGVLLFLSVISFLYSPSGLWILIVPIFGLQILFSLGLGFLLSAISVYLRDIPQIINIFLQGLFFLTPIVYPVDMIPEKIRFLIYLNPLTYFIKSYQDIIIYKTFPGYFNFIVMIMLAFGSLLIGFKVFRKLKDGFADIL